MPPAVAPVKKVFIPRAAKIFEVSSAKPKVWLASVVNTIASPEADTDAVTPAKGTAAIWLLILVANSVSVEVSSIGYSLPDCARSAPGYVERS